MNSKKIFYYVSGHGFGHAVRSALVVRELYRRGLESVIISSAPEYIFKSNLKGVPYQYLYAESDIGVCQRGSLEIDLPLTLRKWRECLDGEKGWIRSQLRRCGELKPVAIVSDIVPFAFFLAQRAGLPSFLVATFTWDWILDFYKDDNSAFGEISKRLHEYYLAADCLIYTPLSYGLPEIKPGKFVPLIGKRSSLSRQEIRSKLGLDERPAFLVSFGGFGLNEVNKLRLEEMKEYQFLFLGGEERREENIHTFVSDKVTHEDLVAVSRGVITKPGYGISCEAVLNQTPMLYTSRGKFAEYEPLVEEVKKYIPANYIPQEELLGGGLKYYLDRLPEFSEGYLSDPGTGAEKTADFIMRSLKREEE